MKGGGIMAIFSDGKKMEEIFGEIWDDLIKNEGLGDKLVDAGISRRQILLRLEQIQSHISEINGIFITHEHNDHIRGLDVLMKNVPRPVYITEKTYNNMSLTIDDQYLNIIQLPASC